MRRAKAYSSFFRNANCQSISSHFVAGHSFLECSLQPKITKINKKKLLFWKFRVFQSHQSCQHWL